MVILGIDPGVAIVGYGILHSVRGKTEAVGYGVIRTKAHIPLEKRLTEIYDDLYLLIEKFKPDEAAVEELFFNTNSKTVIQVGQARGVILLALEKNGIKISEYTPLQVKQAVVGYGRAEKAQVMEMTRRLLNLEKIPKPDDAADALALALCHAQSSSSILHGL